MLTALQHELTGYDATAQAELVRRREVTPLELVNATIALIERLNPHLNAVITPLFEGARARAVSAELGNGPFRGVPLLLKDFLCHTAGDPYYEGMRFLRDLDWRAQHDTYLACQFRAAGFVVLGKTHLPELAALPVTESAAFGPARNPWNLGHTPGGSSGGSAAAVAAGLVPLAHANDGTGSIRIPASACGLVGLKPSRGRTSAGPGQVPGLLGNIVEHVVTRTVRDTAAVLDAVAGPMPGDWWAAPPPTRAYREEVRRPPGRLRVGLLLEEPLLSCPVHDECVAAVHRAARVLGELGHSVEEASPPALHGPSGLGQQYLGVVSASGVAAALDAWSARTGHTIGPQDVEPHIWARAEQGRSYTAVQVHAAVHRLAAGVGRVPDWWAADTASMKPGFDLLLTPTMAQPPPPIGTPVEGLATTFGLFTLPFRYTGQPAISLPVHWTPDGLPVGIQLVAAYGREDVLLRAAAQLESALPWVGRRPPVHVAAA